MDRQGHYRTIGRDEEAYCSFVPTPLQDIHLEMDEEMQTLLAQAHERLKKRNLSDIDALQKEEVENSVIFLLYKFFCKLTKRRHMNADETLHKIGCTSAKRSNKFGVLPSVCTISPQALPVSVWLGKQHIAYPAWRKAFLEATS